MTFFVEKKITGEIYSSHWAVLDKCWFAVNDPDYAAFGKMFPIPSDGSQLAV